MADGDLAAVFKGLAGDAEQAGRQIAESMASVTEQTADFEEANVARTLDAEAQNAQRFTDLTTSSAAASRLGGGAPAAGVPAPESGWTGAGHVSSSSPAAEAAYAAIRQNSGDVPKIAGNTGLSEQVIGQVKSHLFLTEHDVPVGPNQVAHGYFTADEDIADLWHRAEQGTLIPAEQDQFRSLMAHEYVESRLMASGMPYRSADPQVWDDDGTLMFHPDHFGAHDVAPLASNGSLRVWPQLGLTPPATPIAPDLSNIDDVVNAARKGLNL